MVLWKQEIVLENHLILKFMNKEMKNMSLQKLAEMSNRYGSNPEYVLAGGGNTSYKDENYLYVKLDWGARKKSTCK